ncbi:MAG: hypothetical protein PHC51_07935 [bacterium]|nr:hypothetical protein [bacterium]
MRSNSNNQHLLVAFILLSIFVIGGMVEFFRYWDHASKLNQVTPTASSTMLKGG